MARRSWQDDLLKVFSSFAAFGAGRAAGPPELDGAKLAKLARETSILDKVLTTMQVDLIFARVKRKGERKIGFDDFLEACAQMAAIKYPGDAEGFDRIVLKILEAGGPSSSATAVAATDGVCEFLFQLLMARSAGLPSWGCACQWCAGSHRHSLSPIRYPGLDTSASLDVFVYCVCALLLYMQIQS